MIVVIRNPIDRAFSAWDQNTRMKKESRSFTTAVMEELPIARYCLNVAERYFNKQSSQHWDFLEDIYSQQCAHFFKGKHQSCWMSMVATKSFPACKRYLSKGFSAFHLAVWRRYFAKKQILALRSEDVFSGNKNISAVIQSFLSLPTDDDHVAWEQQSKACWHNCQTPKTTVSVTQLLGSSLSATLKGLYAPWIVRLNIMLNDQSKEKVAGSAEPEVKQSKTAGS